MACRNYKTMSKSQKLKTMSKIEASKAHLNLLLIEGLIFMKASTEISALARVYSMMPLNQWKTLINLYYFSHFVYFPLYLTNHSRTLNNSINKRKHYLQSMRTTIHIFLDLKKNETLCPYIDVICRHCRYFFKTPFTF